MAKDEWGDLGDGSWGDDKPRAEKSKKERYREDYSKSRKELVEAHKAIKIGGKEAERNLRDCQVAAKRALKFAHAQDAVADAIVDLNDLTSRQEKEPEFPTDIAGLNPRSVEAFAFSDQQPPGYIDAGTLAEEGNQQAVQGLIARAGLQQGALGGDNRPVVAAPVVAQPQVYAPQPVIATQARF